MTANEDDGQKRTIGPEGLAQFENDLTALRGSDYTYEIEDSEGRMRECDLDDVVAAFQKFRGKATDTFGVSIAWFEGGLWSEKRYRFKRGQP